MLPLHHDPAPGRAYAFQSCQHRFAPHAQIVPSGSPENRTQRHVVISRVWATSPRLPQRQSGRQDSNLRLRAPKARGFAATLRPVVSPSQNGRGQSAGRCPNRRSRGPQPIATSSPSLRSAVSSPCGSRTRLFGSKGRRPRPINERAESARGLCGVGREVLEPSSAAFQAAATPSQLPAQSNKKARRRS